MGTQLRRTFVGAAALLGFGLQGCTSDAVPPLGPDVGAPAFAEGTTGVMFKATKTADTFWRETSTFDWEISKNVTPAGLVLQQGQSGMFNFVINATRTHTGTATTFGMSGQICVTNSGTEPTVNLRISDRFGEFIDGAGTELLEFEVDVSGNPVLDPGESHCYPYSIELDPAFTPNPAATYKNTAYLFSTGLTAEGKPVEIRVFQRTVDVIWPAAPTSADSIDATASVVDALACPAGFTCTPSGAEWTFGETTAQPLAVTVKNVSAPCGTEFEVVNSALLTEDDSETVRGPATATGLIATQECTPPPSIHGCTPGYWKQKHHFDSWTGFTQNQDYDAVFGVDAFSPNRTLLQALSSGGGKMDRLGRHSVAALLNTSNGEVEYGMSTADVIAMVQQAVASGNYDWAADQLEALNERGCPLN